MIKNQGFTLIELIIVIVLMGILAANALPRFVNFSTDTKLDTVKRDAGIIQSSVHQMQALWAVKGKPNTLQTDFSNRVLNFNIQAEFNSDGYITGAVDCSTVLHDCRCLFMFFFEAPAGDPYAYAATSPSSHCYNASGGSSNPTACAYRITTADANQCIYRNENGSGDHQITYNKNLGSVSVSDVP